MDYTGTFRPATLEDLYEVVLLMAKVSARMF